MKKIFLDLYGFFPDFNQFNEISVENYIINLLGKNKKL